MQGASRRRRTGAAVQRPNFRPAPRPLGRRASQTVARQHQRVQDGINVRKLGFTEALWPLRLTSQLGLHDARVVVLSLFRIDILTVLLLNHSPGGLREHLRFLAPLLASVRRPSPSRHEPTREPRHLCSPLPPDLSPSASLRASQTGLAQLGAPAADQPPMSRWQDHNGLISAAKPRSYASAARGTRPTSASLASVSS